VCHCVITDDLRGLVTASGAVSVREPCMFTYDVTMTQVVVVEADLRDCSQLFESKSLTSDMTTTTRNMTENIEIPMTDRGSQ